MFVAIDSGAPTLAAALRGSRSYNNPAFLETLVAAAGPPDPHASPLPWWRGVCDLPPEDAARALDEEEARVRAHKAAQPRARVEFEAAGGVGSGGGGGPHAAALAAARAAAARAAPAAARR